MKTATIVFAVVLGLMPWTHSTRAETIAIIGTGNVAGALGPEFAKQGHTIIYGSRNPDKDNVRRLVARTGDGTSATSGQQAARLAEVVVLAVPGLKVEEVVLTLGDLSGKIIIDPTNPLKRSLLSFEHGVEGSNAELIQALAPKAKVVKAFNTLSWKAMIDPDETGGPVSIPIVGDDKRAKKFVAGLAEGMGLDPIDLGGIENAHWVEGMLILWINNRYGPGESFDYYLRR